MRLPSVLNRLAAVTLALQCAGALADNAELNEMLERNAASAGHARLCNEDPLAEQLKSSTMLVLALSGLPSENVQLGGLKFTDTMRREMRERRKDKDFSCRKHISIGEERVAHANRRTRELREAGLNEATGAAATAPQN